MVRYLKSVLAIVATMAVVLTLAPLAADAAVQTPQGQIVSEDPVDDTPYVVDGKVLSVVQIGDKVVVGGEFTQVKNFGGGEPVVDRNNIFAYDINTRRIDEDFAPSTDLKVETVARAPGGKHVLVGGKFTTVNGEENKKLAKLDIETGERDPNFATTAGSVRDMVVHGNDLYIGGAFTNVNGAERNKLARLDANTGAVDPDFDIDVDVPRGGDWPFVRKIDITPDGERLVLIGNFMQVGGQPREQIAMIDLSTNPATVSPWSTQRFGDECHPVFWTYTRDVEFSPDGEYFVVVTTGSYRADRICDTASRWETTDTPDSQATWIDWTGGDTLYSVAITGSAVYIGGHQRWMNNPHAGDAEGPGAVERAGIAALDPVNGMPFSWNPGRTRGVGAFELVATPDYLIVGSDTDELGGEWHPKLGMFPLEGGTAVPTPAEATLPADVYRVEADTGITERSLDGTTYGAATPLGGGIGDVDAAFMVAGDVYYADGGELYSRSFDGADFGDPVDLDSWVDWSAVGGMTWDNGRLYYTLKGDTQLHYRYFSPESGIVGGVDHVVSGNGDGLDWSKVTTLDAVGGELFYTEAESRFFGWLFGDLRQWSIDFADGTPVAGTQAQISGPGVDALNWDVEAAFHYSPDATPVPTAPDAPRNVYGTPEFGAVNLTWDAPVTDGGEKITGYTATASPGGASVTVDGSTTQATVSGLDNGSTYTFTVTAENGTGTSEASATSNPVAPVGSDGSHEILLVVGDPAALSEGEQALADRLESQGYAVTTADDNAVSAEDADGKALVLITSEVSGGLGDTFKDVDEPVANYKPSLMDDLAMTGGQWGTDLGSVGGQTHLEIVDEAHPLAAGLSGSVRVVSDTNRFTYGTPAGDGEVVATVDGKPTIFSYAAGAELADGTQAAGCRVGVHAFQGTPAQYVTNGWVLFDVAIASTIATCGG